MSKNLIVYFSRRGENYVEGQKRILTEGNTEVIAKMLHSLINSTLFQVETIHDYANDYNQCTQEAKKEWENNERPKILDYVHQFSDYDNVFICYPNWWSTMPMAMFTFLEHHDTRGKNIFPLCTHEGSGMGRSVKDIQKLCPHAHVFKGLAIRGSQVKEAENQIKDWLKELGYEKEVGNGNMTYCINVDDLKLERSSNISQ